MFINSNKSLVSYLISIGFLKTQRIIDAFMLIRREDFLEDFNKAYAYLDEPLSILQGQTISQPSVCAFMLELLDIKANSKVLDIGSGSGYTTSLISRIIHKEATVLGLERIPALIKFGQDNLNKYYIQNAKIQKAEDSLGIKNEQFDRILVSAAAKSLPEELLLQLKNYGKMVIPIKNSIFLITKVNNMYKKKEYVGFTFVPLIH